jgi:hypothetical protein
MCITVIMVSGKSHNGKGEFSRKLEEIYKNKTNHNIIRCSLSTYIRDITKNDFYWDGVDTPKSRKFMGEVYRLGTEIYPYHMARRVWERDIIPNLINDKNNIVILESFREKNNYDYFNNLQDENKISNIITIRINRPNFDHAGKEMLNHVSESDLDKFLFDYEVLNDSTIEDLHIRTEKIFNCINSKEKLC